MEKEEMGKLLGLEKDELVLWSGKPAPFQVMDKYYKPVFIRNYIIALVIVVPIFTTALIRNANGGELNLLALSIMCAIPLVVIPLGISQYRNYGKNCRYFLTNKNIIVVWESRKLKLPVSDINNFDSVPQSEDTVSVRIGKAVGMPVKKNRDFALRCLAGNTTEEQDKGCLLYNLSESDAATVLGLIEKCRVVA